METALNKLKKRVAEQRLQDRNKIERQIGRIQARHPQVADLYQMEVVPSAGGLRLEWTVLKERHIWQQLREGAYLLRTNLSGESAGELWKKYIQLTEAEAAFRTLKSELSIRPIFHQARKTGQGACAGGLSGLRLVGDTQTLPAPQESKDISGPSVVDPIGSAQR